MALTLGSKDANCFFKNLNMKIFHKKVQKEKSTAAMSQPLLRTCHLLTQNPVTHSNALERALIVDTIFTNKLPAHRPVRATDQTDSTENTAKT